jgi:uroporphyrinogen decarboxylase
VHNHIKLDGEEVKMVSVVETNSSEKAQKKTRLLRALRCESVDKTPVWMMRQAGRYLPEYRKVREKAGNFMTLCQTPELAAEVTLQPLARFDLDAAIIFSDILTVPHAMGMPLQFLEGEGPVFENPLQNVRDIERLTIPDPEDSLRYVLDALRLTRRELAGAVPLIGFSGSPWTLACYMVEGKGSKQFQKIKTLCYRQPEVLELLLQKLEEALVLMLNAQIAAGAQVIMIFDTWGGILSTPDYHIYSLSPIQRILSQLNTNAGEIPTVVFTKGGGQWLSSMADCGADALGIDWTTDLSIARKLVGDKVALQGNLDPMALYAPPHVIEEKVAECLRAYGEGNGHVFNLGHGITPDTPIDHVTAFIESVHRLSVRARHGSTDRAPK